MNEPQNILTGLDYDAESDAWAHFDAFADKCKGFRVYKEVWGDYVQPRPGADQKRARIDRLIVPYADLIEAGWPHGPFGVEGKKSGEKIGKAISQALDYNRCVFELPHGFLVMLRWVFLYPVDGAGGDIGSVMAQNRIGWVRSSQRTPLVFGCGGTHGIELHSDGTLKAKELPMGNKTGNRG